MCVQTFGPKAAIERFDKSIVRGLARFREVEFDTALVSPQIQVARYEFGALIDPNACRESHLSADPFQHLDDIGAAECEPRLQCRREARERIDNREHAK